MIGDKLKMLRERRKMTRKDLEKITEIKVARLCEYEKNKRTPRLGRINLLANALGVKAAYFFKE